MSDDLRSTSPFADGFWVGDWFVEPMLNRVRHEDEDEEVQLEPKVMEVLLCLAERSGKTVTKSQFKDVVWTDTVVTDDVLSRCISQLRKVFNDDSRDPSYIETIRKTGYRLIAPVEIPEASTDDAQSVEVQTGSEATSPFRRLIDRVSSPLRVSFTGARGFWVVVAESIVERKWILAIGAVLAVILLVSVVSWSDVEIGTTSKAPPPATPLTTFPGEEFDPMLSSSGQQVVFAWRNADSLYQNIYLMQRGADRPLRLSADTTVDWSPAWSPQGRFVAYAREAGDEHQVAIVPSIGGHPRLVVRMPRRRIHSVAWSPDTAQTTLAVSAQQRPHRAFALSVRLPDADSVRSITAPSLWSTGDTSPVFSPDGRRIAFVRGLVKGVENVFVVPTAGGEPIQVTTDSTAIYGLAWSSDGDDLLYSAHRGGVNGLWRVDAEGGTPSLVRAASEGTFFRHPSVSGQRLAYTQQSAQLDVWTLRRSSRYDAFQAAPAISSTQEDTDPSVSPDGTRLAFVSERSGHPEVWTAGIDGATPTQITSLNGPSIRSVTWSSDGTRLSFVARQNGNANLFVVPASGGPLTQITNTASEVLAPQWGHDDRWLYYASNETGTWDVWRTPPDTARVQQVTAGGALAAQESPSGEMLYLVRPDTTGIWAAPLDTTQFPLRTRPADSLVAQNSSAEGTPSPSLVAERKNESNVRRVVAAVEPRDYTNWRIGPEGVYFLRHRRFRTAVLTYHDLESGQSVPLYTFSNWHPDHHLTVGPAGDTFAYTHAERRESDVMFIELSER